MLFIIWTICDTFAAIQIKFHTDCKSLKEELGKANSKLLSMEEVVKLLLKFPASP